MKFENIKVGDEVLIPKNIPYGWKGGKTFYITACVTRVTKTQFCCGEVRAKKENGNIIGDGWNQVYRDGDNAGIGENTIKDQTLEMNAFRKRISVYNKIRNWSIDLKSINVENTELSKLNKISELIDEIDNITKGI